jgi:hypothetical protein
LTGFVGIPDPVELLLLRHRRQRSTGDRSGELKQREP